MSVDHVYLLLQQDAFRFGVVRKKVGEYDICGDDRKGEIISFHAIYPAYSTIFGWIAVGDDYYLMDSVSKKKTQLFDLHLDSS